jgi:hypothetical protein
LGSHWCSDWQSITTMAYILRGEDAGQPHQCSRLAVHYDHYGIHLEDVGQPRLRLAVHYDHYGIHLEGRGRWATTQLLRLAVH